MLLLFLVSYKFNDQSVTLDLANAWLRITELNSEHHSVGAFGVFANDGNLNFKFGLSMLELKDSFNNIKVNTWFGTFGATLELEGLVFALDNTISASSS